MNPIECSEEEKEEKHQQNMHRFAFNLEKFTADQYEKCFHAGKMKK